MGKVIEGQFPGGPKIEFVDRTKGAGGGDKGKGGGGGSEGGPGTGGGRGSGEDSPPKKRLRDSNFVRGALAALALGGAGELHGRSVGQDEAYQRGAAAGEKTGFEKGKNEGEEKGKKEAEEIARQRLEKLRADKASSVPEDDKKKVDEKEDDHAYASKAHSELSALYIAVKYGKSAGKKETTVEAKIAHVKAREIMANYRRWMKEEFFASAMANDIIGLLPSEEVKKFAAENPDFKRVLVNAGVTHVSEIQKLESEIDIGTDDGKKLNRDDKEANRYEIAEEQKKLRALNSVLE